MDAFSKVNRLQVKDYEDFVKRYGSDKAMNRAFAMVTSFYALLGQLLFRKLIDIDLVYDITGGSWILTFYENVKPIVLGKRRELGEPTYLVELEYLCDELRRREPQLRKTWKKYLSQN